LAAPLLALAPFCPDLRAAHDTEFPRKIGVAVLAHTVGSKTEQAYRRNTAIDKRRKLMEAWAAYCASTPGERGKVVAFKAARD
jgi:hypothetical protein